MKRTLVRLATLGLFAGCVASAHATSINFQTYTDRHCLDEP
jgi:hypothetical protein